MPAVVVGSQRRRRRRPQLATAIRRLGVLSAHQISDTVEEALDDGENALSVGQKTRLRLDLRLKAAQRSDVVAAGVGNLPAVIGQGDQRRRGVDEAGDAAVLREEVPIQTGRHLDQVGHPLAAAGPAAVLPHQAGFDRVEDDGGQVGDVLPPKTLLDEGLHLADEAGRFSERG